MSRTPSPKRELTSPPRTRARLSNPSPIHPSINSSILNFTEIQSAGNPLFPQIQRRSFPQRQRGSFPVFPEIQSGRISPDTEVSDINMFVNPELPGLPLDYNSNVTTTITPLLEPSSPPLSEFTDEIITDARIIKSVPNDGKSKTKSKRKSKRKSKTKSKRKSKTRSKTKSKRKSKRKSNTKSKRKF